MINYTQYQYNNYCDGSLYNSFTKILIKKKINNKNNISTDAEQTRFDTDTQRHNIIYIIYVYLRVNRKRERECVCV